MVAVPGEGNRSPRHFCEECAKRLRRGPALTDGGAVEAGDTRQQVCEWCRLPKFGDDRCICDSPKFRLMGICDDCGEWTDVDRLFSEEWDSDEEYCNGCYVHTGTERSEGER
jgi:hypothetical protein